MRTIRLPMDGAQRRSFLRIFGVALIPVVIAYAMLTVLRDFTEQVAARVRVHGIPERDDELARLARRLDGVASPTDVGATICELFELLEGLSSPPAASLRSDVHVHLRSLADREVDLLADALG